MVKVERSYPAPESLEIESKKENGSYREKDVVERLKADFHDKCYICEIKGLQDPQVEHLLPHKNGKYRDRKYDWNNLFLSCSHCNNVKNNGKYDEGIIDCCREDPEELLRFSLNEDDICIEAVDQDDEKCKLTAELIYEAFNLKNTGIRVAACENRMESLKKSMLILYQALENYKKHPKSVKNIQMIRSLLRRESAFAAFKRGYVRARLSIFPEFEDFVR